MPSVAALGRSARRVTVAAALVFGVAVGVASLILVRTVESRLEEPGG